ncbi:hypothetical protein ACFSTA_00980 [Ornithinibacillus salinisoli]|uniref:DUF3784 domain-containing protein n=1 Tax=Ornithinibacillus salinisoli TaxID=1848459 RepID=A0ABW4VUE1_9BACI
MNILLGVLSILWGITTLIFFFFKLKEKDFSDFKVRNELGDEGFPLLVIWNWILRKLPIAFIRSTVIVTGLIFIIGGIVII